MALKASELSAAMVAQLPTAWSQVKGVPPDAPPYPGGDTKDAEVMFRAVALGLITYLQQQEGKEAITRINTSGGGGGLPSFDVDSVEWKTE